MSYSTQYAAARDASFLQRLEIALTVYARDVIQNDTKTTPNRLNRAALATEVLRDAAAWAQRFKDAVAANGVSDADIDGAFYSAVVFYWDAYAGIITNGAVAIP